VVFRNAPEKTSFNNVGRAVMNDSLLTEKIDKDGNIRNSSYITRSRGEVLFASLLAGTIGSYVVFVVIYGIFFSEAVSSIVQKVLVLCGLSLLSIWLFFFSIFFYQPNVKLYNNYFRRSGVPRFNRRFIKFNDIEAFTEIQDKKGMTGLAFIMKDGFRFFIPTDQLDSEFQKIFIDRLDGHGIKTQGTKRVKYFPDFLNEK
jgi:hypothetical protein